MADPNPFAEEEPRACEHGGHGKSTYKLANQPDVIYKGHQGGDAELLYTFICPNCDRVVTKAVCEGLRQHLVGLSMYCSSCGHRSPTAESVFYEPLRCEDRVPAPRGMLRCTLPAGHNKNPLSLHAFDLGDIEES